MDPGVGTVTRYNVFVFGGLFSERQQIIKDIALGTNICQNATGMAQNDSLRQLYRHESVEVYLFQEEETTSYKIWNFSDKKMDQGICQLFINEWSIVLIVVDEGDCKDTEKIYQIWRNFSLKGVSNILLVSNGNKQLTQTEEVIKIFRALDGQPLHVTKVEPASREYHITDYKGVCKTLKSIKAALHQNTEISNSALKDVLANIGAKCRDGIVFCGKKDVNTSTALSEEELTRVEHYIFRQGLAISFGHSKEEDGLICINPILFLNLIYAVHIDSCNKTFRIAPDKFWAAKSTTRPDSLTLVKVIEDIPLNGLMRQSLLPILCQNLLTNADQIVTLSTELERLGILVPCKKMSTYSDVLCLAAYPQLSAADQMSLVLMGKIADAKPSLNWYEDLQPSDIQLVIKIHFSQGTASGFLERYLAAVNFAYKQVYNYQYCWKSGLLLRVQDVYIYISIKDNTIIINVRTNVELFVSLEAASEELWITVSLALMCFLKYSSDWKAITFEISICAIGGNFIKQCGTMPSDNLTTLLKNRYNHRPGDTDTSYPGYLDALFPFKDFKLKYNDDQGTLQEWLHYLILKADVSLNKAEMIPKFEVPTPSAPKDKSLTKKKRKDITWVIPKDDQHMDSNTNETEVPKDESQIPKVKSINNAKKPNTKNTPMDAKTEKTNVCEVPVADDQTLKEEDIEKFANSFIAAILALGVADFIKEECENNRKWNAYQATVACEMAEAIMFVNSPDILAAAKAVVNSVEKAGRSDGHYTPKGCCVNGTLCYCGNHRHSQAEHRTKLSSVCAVL